MNYSEARDVLSGKLGYGYARKLAKPNPNRLRVKIANNTYLERRSIFNRLSSFYRDLPDNAIGLRLHETYVVIFTPHFVEFNTGGYPTMTTADRMRIGPGYVAPDKSVGGWAWHPINPDKLCSRCDGSGIDQTAEWMNPDGVTARQRWIEAGSNPAESTSCYMQTPEGYTGWTPGTCGNCQGTGKHEGLDWSNPYPFYDGLRVRNDGRGILRTQPHRPEHFQPIVTLSGFTGGSIGFASHRQRY